MKKITNFRVTNRFDNNVRLSDYPGSQIKQVPLTLSLWRQIFEYYHFSKKMIISQMISTNGRDEIDWGDGSFSIFTCDVNV